MKKLMKLGKTIKGNVSNSKKNSTVDLASSPSNSGNGNQGYIIDLKSKDKDISKLHKVCWSGAVDSVKSLVKKVDVNLLDKENRSPLHLACAQGFVEIVQILIASKARINLRDSEGRTPLLKALQCYHENCALLLLDSGADIELADNDGNGPLHVAAYLGLVKTVEKLVQRKSCISVKNNDGNSPLHLAAEERQITTCLSLLNGGSNVNSQNANLRTPLMIACSHGDHALVSIILKFNPNTNLKDSQGWTADDCAIIKGYHICSSLIGEYNYKKDNNVPSDVENLSRPASVKGSNSQKSIPLSRSCSENQIRISPEKDCGDSWNDSEDDGVLINTKKSESSNEDEMKSVPGIKLAKILHSSSESLNKSSPKIKPAKEPIIISPVSSTPKPNEIVSKTASNLSPLTNFLVVRDNATVIKVDNFLDISEDSVHNYEKDFKIKEETKNSQKEESILSKTRSDEKASEKDKQKALMLELGLSDVSDRDISTPDLSENSFKLKTQKKDEILEKSNISPIQPPPKPQRLFSDELNSPILKAVNDGESAGSGLIESDHSSVKTTRHSKDFVNDSSSSSFDSPILKHKLNLSTKNTSERNPAPSQNSEIDKALQNSYVENDSFKVSFKASSEKSLETMTKNEFFKESPKNSSIEKHFDPNSLVIQSHRSSVVEEELKKHSFFSNDKLKLYENKKDEIKSSKIVSTNEKSLQKVQKAHINFDSDSDWDSEGGHETSSIESPCKEIILSPKIQKTSNHPEMKEKSQLQIPMKFDSVHVDSKLLERKMPLSYKPSILSSLQNKKDFEKSSDIRFNSSLFDNDKSINYTKQIKEPVIPLEEFHLEKKNNILVDDNIDDDSSWSSDHRDSSASAEPVLLKITKNVDTNSTFDRNDTHNKIIILKEEIDRSESPSKFIVSRKHRSELDIKRKDWKNGKNPGHISSSYPSLVDRLINETELFESAGDEKSSSTTDEYIKCRLSYRNSNGNMVKFDGGDSIQIQNVLQQERSNVDKERSLRISLETKVRILESEKLDLERRMDNLNKIKSKLEEGLLETEARNHSLESSLNEKIEKCKDVEILLSKNQERLACMEQKYTLELEGRERSEHQERSLQIEMRTIVSKLKQLEDEKEEITSQLEQETKTRCIQDHFIKKNIKQQIDENKKLFSHQAVVLSRLDEADITRQQALSQCEQMQSELIAVKQELEFQRSSSREQHNLLNQEKEELKLKIDKLKREEQLQEISLSEMSRTFNLQLETLKTENSNILVSLKKEKTYSAKLTIESESLKNHIKNAEIDLNKTQEIRRNLERNLEKQSEELQQLRSKSEKEMHALQDRYQNLVQNSSLMENKFYQSEKELNIANAMLSERTDQLTELKKELNQKKNVQEENVKLTAKVDFLQERLHRIQEESLLLTQKYEDKLCINKSMAEENKEFEHLREELNHAIFQKNTIEKQLTATNKELNDISKQLAISEGEIHINQKILEHTELEKSLAKDEIEKLQKELEILQKKLNEEYLKSRSLEDIIDKSKKVVSPRSPQPIHPDPNVLLQIKTGQEELLHRLEMENSRLEAALQHEMERIEYLEQESRDSLKVRSNMEALISSLKSANYHLEFKLKEEVEARVVMANEIEEGRQMWESEIKSCSRLAQRLSQIETMNEKVEDRILEEKKKTHRALILKKKSELKLEEGMKKITDLNKKISVLKTQILAYKKKLKDAESQSHHIQSMQSQYELDHHSMENTTLELKMKLQELQVQLQNESENKEKLEALNLKLYQELNARKSAIKNIGKVQWNKQKVQDEFSLYKAYVEQNYIPKSELERIKFELETQSRQELNKKLDQVNNYLEDQALVQERLDIIRNNAETEMKADFDKTKQQLMDELIKLRSCFEERSGADDILNQERKRYKELYEGEIKTREKLNKKLAQLSERTSPNKLLFEKQITNKPFPMFGDEFTQYNASTPINSDFLNPAVLSPPTKESLSYKLKSELDKAINKHLQDGSNVIECPPSIDDNAMNLHENQYLSLLQRKYFV